MEDSLSLSADLDMTGFRSNCNWTRHVPAPGTAFMAVLLEVDEKGQADIVSAGYRRASLRAVDETASKPGAPVLPCTNFEAVPIDEKVRYRIDIVPNSRRFRAGHKIRLPHYKDDQDKNFPAPLQFRHASIGTSSLNTVFSSSRLWLLLLKGPHFSQVVSRVPKMLLSSCRP
jgi:uncharacterized protein